MNSTQKIKAVILKNEDPFDHLSWEKACIDYGDSLEVTTIDLTLNDWLDEITAYKPDICFLKPAGKTSIFRDLYQERVDILVNELKMKVFPTLNEIKIYESKRFFAYWAMANGVPHPKTSLFYHKKEAREFIKKAHLPMVGKLNIGASGNGIQVLKTKDQVLSYAETAFSNGLASRTGPKLEKGQLIQRIWQKLTHPSELKNRLKTYRDISADKQKGYLILQEFIPHDFEWRVVRIGDSYFAHKKLKLGEMSSGSLLKEYENPPMELLNFVKKITDKHQFYSVAVDIFESEKGYLVNEIQCIFGQSDPFQMKVNDRMGRYIFENNKWVFQEGDYAKNACYNLRVEYAQSHFVRKGEDLGK